MSQTANNLFFIRATIIASKLSSVLQYAKDISLAAKNAKAVTARAGDKANGFKPITDFIDTMSHETTSLINAISKESLCVSRASIAEIRSREAFVRFRNAADLSTDHEASQQLAILVHKATDKLQVHKSAVTKSSRALQELLDKIQSQIRAASIISTCSQVEAVRTGQYEKNLQVVTNTVDQASIKIKTIVSECKSILSG